MSTRFKKACPLACSKEVIEQLRELAASKTAGIWRIKRAKALLGMIDRKSPEKLMYQVRVPVTSIVKCLMDFSRTRMAYFDRAQRPPTPREAAVERMLGLLEDPSGPFSNEWETFSVRYIGTHFTTRQIHMIRQMIATDPNQSLVGIARQMCSVFKLYSANGKLRTAIATDILRRMAMDNLIFLPAQRSSNCSQATAKVPPKLAAAPQEVEELASIKSLSPIIVVAKAALYP